MNIVVTLFSLALILIPAHVRVTSQSVVQSGCSLTEANAPSVHGVRLGLGTDQLVALFPGSSNSREIKDAVAKAKAADASETVYLSFDAGPGGDSISAGVNKGRVVDFTVVYVGPTWRTVNEWIGKLAETFKLPAAGEWVVGPNEAPNKILKCSGVEIEAAMQGGGGSIRVRNTEYTRGIEERNAAGEEKKRREFKP